MANNTDGLSVPIDADPSGLRQGLREAEDEIQRFVQSVQRISEVGKALQDLGSALTKAITIPLAGLATAAIKAYADIQSLQLGLEAVVGSADKAGREFERLKEVAQLPGLGMEEAVKGSINLQSIGFSAKNARNILQQFGNAVATVGKGRAEFERAIYGVQQLANTKFPLGEDLNIIKDAVPQVSKLLTEAFGTSRSDELAKLGKTSQEVLGVIIKGLEDLPRVSGGIKGAFENLYDGMKTQLARIGKIIDDNIDISGLVDKITKAVDDIVTAFEDLDPTIQKIIIGFAAAVAAIGPLLVAIGAFMAALPTITAGVGALATAFTFLSGPIGLVVVGIGAIVAAVVANWDKIKPYLDDSILRFKILYNESTAFRLILSTIGFSFEAVARVAIGALGIIYENFKDIGKGILNIWSAIGEQIEGVFTLDFEKIGRGTVKGLQAVNGILADTTRNSISGLIGIGQAIDAAEKRWSNFRFSLTEKIKLGGEDEDLGNHFAKSIDFAKKKVEKKAKETTIDLTGIKLNTAGLIDEIGREFDTLTELTSSIFQRDLKINATILPYIDIDGALKKVIEGAERMKTAVNNFNGEASQILNQAIIDGIYGAMDALGNALATGGNVLQAVGTSLLSTLGGLLSDLGKMAISTGVTLLAIKLGLQSLNPYVMIAAGAALVALGSFVKGSTGKIGNSIGSSGGGSGGSISTSTGSSTSGSSYSSNYATANSGGGEYVFRIQGQDLVAVFEANTSRKNRLNTN